MHGWRKTSERREVGVARGTVAGDCADSLGNSAQMQKFARRTWTVEKMFCPQCLEGPMVRLKSEGDPGFKFVEAVNREFLRLCIRNNSDFRGFQARNNWELREEQQGCLWNGTSHRAGTSGRSLLPIFVSLSPNDRCTRQILLGRGSIMFGESWSLACGSHHSGACIEWRN